MEYDSDIRNYLSMLEYYANADPAPVEEIVCDQSPTIDLEPLRDIVFRLRSYTDPTGGEFSLGFEQGLEMAAQMIVNYLNNMGNDCGS